MMPEGRPVPGALAYYRVSWRTLSPDDPDTFWHEVDHDGRVLRTVEILPDGSALTDNIDRYPDGISDFGFGTLAGDDFYRVLPWIWPDQNEPDPVVVLGAHAWEFEAIWNRATAA